MQRLFRHRAAFDRKHRRPLFETALQAFDQRALARADRTHEIKHLAAFLAVQRGGMEVTHELRDSALNAKEFGVEKRIKFEGLVAEEAFELRVLGLADVLNSFPTYRFVNA